MFSKKIILSVLALSALYAGKIQANDSEKFAGEITKKEAKDFLAGFGIGLVHGFVNHATNIHYKDINAANDPFFSLFALTYNTAIPIFTYKSARRLENSYTGNKENVAMLWGHGIGQFFAESIVIERDKYNNPQVKMYFSLNMSLIKAFFSNSNQSKH